MRERFSKKSCTNLDSFQNTFGPNAELGVEIKCTPSGKNKFILKVEICSPLKIYYLMVSRYYYISMPEFSKLLPKVHPDFIFKPTKFMSFKKMAELLNANQDDIAVIVMKNIKKTFANHLPYAVDGISIGMTEWSGSEITEHTPKFKSFSEFLVWTDLNVF